MVETMREQRLEQAEQFLSMLFEYIPTGWHFYLWTLELGKDGKKYPKSHWYQTVGDAMEFVRGNLDDDIYVGRTISSAKGEPGDRVKNNEAEGIVALVADMDYHDEVHSKKDRLPPDYDTALGISKELRLAPTIKIHTGHGLHCWWVFKEPWVFDDDEERESAITLSRRWHETIKADMTNLGYTLDSTFDLSRVMRVPGTLNTKNSMTPRRVGMIEVVENGSYDPTDFKDYLVDESQQEKVEEMIRRGEGIIGDIHINPGATMPERLSALVVQSDRARDIWNHDSSIKLEDDSPSGWDMALANIMALNGLSPQEMADGLIVFRRKYGAKEKLSLQYYHLTITKAFNQSASARRNERSMTAMEELNYIMAGGPPKDLTDKGWKEYRRRLLDLLSDAVTEHTPVRFSDARTYLVESRRVFVFNINGNEISRDGNSIFTSQMEFIRMVLDGALVRLRKVKNEEWDVIATALLTACEEVDAARATDRDVMVELLDDFLQATSEVSPVSSFDSTVRPAIVIDGHVAVNSVAFRRHIRQVHGINRSPGKVSAALDSIGCEQKDVDFLVERRRGRKQKQSKRYWLLPIDEFPIESYVVHENEDYLLREGMRGS